MTIRILTSLAALLIFSGCGTTLEFAHYPGGPTLARYQSYGDADSVSVDAMAGIMEQRKISHSEPMRVFWEGTNRFTGEIMRGLGWLKFIGNAPELVDSFGNAINGVDNITTVEVPVEETVEAIDTVLP